MMEERDFFDLKIGQKIYYQGKEVEIDFLGKVRFAKIAFTHLNFRENFRDIMEHLSFDPPKVKKKYWLWKYDEGAGWSRGFYYRDDTGYCTNGRKFKGALGWNDMKKIKIEDDFIEVEW